MKLVQHLIRIGVPYTVTLVVFCVTAAQSLAAAPAQSEAIPMDQLGAVAGKQYHGDGLSVAATPEGARLRCVFQKLEGQVTAAGLWLTSTTDASSGERFRIIASAVGRQQGGRASAQALTSSPFAEMFGLAGTLALPEAGQVEVTDQVVRFNRPGLTEEYSVSMDGVRQDFVVLERPEGAGQLRLELDVTGARVEPRANSARLVLDGSGRKIAYSRLRATDATGRELPARIEVADHSALRTPHSAFGMAVLVDDAEATYPVRIDPTFTDDNWISMGGVPGANYQVIAAVADDAGNLYISGGFSVVGDVVANGIAKWNGSSWSALGSGMEGGNDPSVYALAVSGSNLYVGGTFTTVGGNAANNVAKWDGSSWSALGPGVGGGSVTALAVSGSDLYVGGSFTTAGGSPANYVAKWNGNSWSALGSGVGSASSQWFAPVCALAVSGSNLYVGGSFTTAGGSEANYVAKWDGSSWSALGPGVGSSVTALAVSGSDLYAGGVFTDAGGIAANHVAKWDGSSWSALGSGVEAGGGYGSHHVEALAVAGSNLYVGGWFTKAGGSSANYVAKWDGNTWSALGTGVGPSSDYPVAEALAVSGSNLYVGGWFGTAGSSAAHHVAKWDGNSWSALGAGIGGVWPRVNAFAVLNSELYAGGYFTTAAASPVTNVAKWNGNSWSALGSGIGGAGDLYVFALATSGSNLYVGGYFTTAGGSEANYVAKWDGSSWSALGAGLNGYVNALAVSGSDLYVGGYFTTAGGSEANNVAKWDGSSWSALGAGLNGDVNTLAVSGTNLYAGGYFTTAGGSAANRIAKWDGSSWSALGSGVNSYVYALVMSASDLYVGGEFTTAGSSPANNVAKWDGSSWSALGAGLGGANYRVDALAVSGSELYAGGFFTTAGGGPATGVAKWDGNSWSTLGSGVGGHPPVVYALFVSGSELYVGGGFTIAGGKASACVAKAFIAAGGQFSHLAYSPATGFSCAFSDATAGQSYRVQTSPSLAAGSWTDVTNFTYTNPITINDPAAVGTTPRFYRAVSP